MHRWLIEEPGGLVRAYVFDQERSQRATCGMPRQMGSQAGRQIGKQARSQARKQAHRQTGTHARRRVYWRQGGLLVSARIYAGCT